VTTEKRVSKGNLLLAALPVADRMRLTGNHPPVDLAFLRTSLTCVNRSISLRGMR